MQRGELRAKVNYAEVVGGKAEEDRDSGRRKECGELMNGAAVGSDTVRFI